MFKTLKKKNSFFHELIHVVPWFTIGDVSVTDIFAIELFVSVKRRMDREWKRFYLNNKKQTETRIQMIKW